MNDTHRELEELFRKFDDLDPVVIRDSVRKFLAIEAGSPERISTFGSRYLPGLIDVRVVAVGILATKGDVSDVDILVKTFEVAEEESNRQIPEDGDSKAYFRASNARTDGKDVKKAVVDTLFSIRTTCERNDQVEEFDAMMDLALEDTPVRAVLSEAMEVRKVTEPPPKPAECPLHFKAYPLKAKTTKRPELEVVRGPADAEMDGSMSKGTVKPPTKKEDPQNRPDKGPIKKKR